MAKSAMIRARVEPSLKKSVESIFKKLGISTTEAITLFYNQVKLNKGIPFEIKIPNEETIATFKSTERGEGLIESENVDKMFEKLGI